ncbi:hypothetical protein OEA41_007300 [Lepraria neglecta]|uniref:Hydrophobin n=1 Tax=Lepraria neglecta TaxID=209136 RepID=A0AAE0DMU7_9LECA|nr:hypothetical protein OEA41_007300 [Lepraria neglecta]
MQFQSIIAILAMAVAATAAPSPNPIISPATAPQCAAGQTTACCSSSLSGVLPIDLPCLAVTLIGILNPSCSPTQQLACCNSGPQTGNVIAVGTICAPISAS